MSKQRVLAITVLSKAFALLIAATTHARILPAGFSGADRRVGIRRTGGDRPGGRRPPVHFRDGRQGVGAGDRGPADGVHRSHRRNQRRLSAYSTSSSSRPTGLTCSDPCLRGSPVFVPSLPGDGVYLKSTRAVHGNRRQQRQHRRPRFTPGPDRRDACRGNSNMRAFAHDRQRAVQPRRDAARFRR